MAEKTQAKISAARQGYQPVAVRASQLYFCIANLAQVDPMYQYSLEWYSRLFLLAFSKAPKAENGQLDRRLTSLKDTFTRLLYESVCRSLFEKDKLLFSFQLCTTILVGEGRLDPAELRFLLQGSNSLALRRPNPGPAGGWLSDKAWADVLELSSLPAFSNFDRFVEGHLPKFAALAESADPLADISKILGDGPHANRPFDRLLVLRCFRMNRLVPAIRAFVASELGKDFVDPPVFDLQRCYGDSSAVTPLVFVLSPGSDPMAQLLALADKVGKGKKLVTISLGQGQGPLAEKAISDAVSSGGWVALQNCHLSESWLPSLERIIEDLRPETVHEEFRLWLTAAPSPKFPVSVLQTSVKMTLELPRGLRASMTGSLRAIDEGWLTSVTSRSDEFKRLVYGLAFFHAVISERRKFGPLGFNIPYAFAESDLRISLDQLKLFLSDPVAYPSIPFEALNYLIGHCNYGGRVTDDQDRRLLLTILSDVVNGSTSGSDGAKLSASGAYCIPSTLTLTSFLDEARSLPMSDGKCCWRRCCCVGDPYATSCELLVAAVDSSSHLLPETFYTFSSDAGPEVFGLHDNAEISCAIDEATALTTTAVMLQPRSSAAAATPPSATASAQSTASSAVPAATASSVSTADAALAALAADIEGKLPPPFDVDAIAVRYPVQYEESLNTVLQQECMRYNNLVAVVRRSLRDVQQALKGLVVMTSELEAQGQSMTQGKVPELWKAAAYPSTKPLGSWIVDLLARLAFLQRWIDKGKPPVFWLSGFFFTPSFLTSVRQNYARKHKLPIDLIAFDVRALSPAECEAAAAASSGPEDGVYVSGLFLVGARWDSKMGTLADSRPRELHTELPIIHLLPRKAADIDPHAHVYRCPVYRTGERAGTLST